MAVTLHIIAASVAFTNMSLTYGFRSVILQPERTDRTHMKTSDTRVEIAAPDIFIMGCLISIMFRNSLIIPPANIIIMAL